MSIAVKRVLIFKRYVSFATSVFKICFSVRYFGQFPEHKDIFKNIENRASQVRRGNCNELRRKKEEYNYLMRLHDQSECDYYKSLSIPPMISANNVTVAVARNVATDLERPLWTYRRGRASSRGPSSSRR